MKKILLVVLAMVLLVVFAGCEDENGVTYFGSQEGQTLNLKKDKEGLTAEQANIKKRLELSSDPNAIWWIYCLSDTGTVVFYGAVKGKVTSSGKALKSGTSETKSGVSIEMGYDGAYGGSDPYVYWFDPAGVYYQWNGKYFLTSREVNIQNPVLNFRGVK